MICLNPLLLNVFSAPTISPSQVFLKLTIYIFLERLKCLEAIVSPKTYWKWKLWLPLHYDISTFSSFLFWNCSPSVLYLIIYYFCSNSICSRFSVLIFFHFAADDQDGLLCLEQLEYKGGCEDGHCSSWLLLQMLLPIIFYRNLWLIWVLWNSSSLGSSAFVLIRSGKKANKRLEVLSIHAGREYAWNLCIE